MILQRLQLLTTLVMSSLAAAAGTQPQGEGPPAGLLSDVVFTEYSPLSGAAEVTRRLMSPLNALRVSRALQRSGRAVRDQSIDLTQERFAVYVPAHAPPGGYSLLVFVPPWREAAVPRQWLSTLERHGVIYVSAANSGNDADVLDRREPLALLAAANVSQRYPVNPARIYVGGFSGGSRVALRLALGYPDLFSGVFLDAGSDPIGSVEIPLPPADLFKRFQEATRVVYVSGGHDDFHLEQDKESQQSLQGWCVLDLVTEDAAWTAHEVADARAFNRVLDALENRKARPSNQLAQCRARIDGELTAQLHRVAELAADAKSADASAAVRKIDARYGGLAAPQSVELAEKAGSE
jgi:pimeloyl-ACP methyl ester carboxylesterase